MSREALSEVSFEELLQRVRSGDASAFNELFRRSRPTLDKLAARHRDRVPPDGARPSDISQALSERVLRGFSTFKGNTAGEWFGWLKKVFRNHMVQSSRDAHRQKREATGIVSLDGEEAVEVPSHDRSPSQITADREEWRRLFACIYELPEDQREAIILHELEELPVAEIARHMGTTKSSVEGLLHRGWKRVKARMKGELDAEAVGGLASQGEATVAFMAYLRLREVGEKVDRDAFIAEHPTCADELRDMLHWIERFQAYRPRPSTK
jgi:RNA polymerase sigma-70 factor (ECF subfamily)